jgi:hypothetical protein
MPHKRHGLPRRLRRAAPVRAHQTKTSTGMKHEIEVCDEHRKDIDEVLEALDSFTGHARRIGPNAAQRRGQQQAAPAKAGRRGNTDCDTKAVRQWAAANGVEVSERGRISTTVLEQYRAAAVSGNVRLIVRPLDERDIPDDVKDLVLAKMFLELTADLDSEVAVNGCDQLRYCCSCGCVVIGWRGGPPPSTKLRRADPTSSTCTPARCRTPRSSATSTGTRSTSTPQRSSCAT